MTKIPVDALPFIVARSKDGDSCHTIGLTYGVTGNAVSCYLKRHGVEKEHAFKVRRRNRIDAIQNTIDKAMKDLRKATKV